MKVTSPASPASPAIPVCEWCQRRREDLVTYVQEQADAAFTEHMTGEFPAHGALYLKWQELEDALWLVRCVL